MKLGRQVLCFPSPERFYACLGTLQAEPSKLLAGWSMTKVAIWGPTHSMAGPRHLDRSLFPLVEGGVPLKSAASGVGFSPWPLECSKGILTLVLWVS